MDPFSLAWQPLRLWFGEGAIGRVGEALDELGCRRALLVRTPSQRVQAESLITRHPEGIAAQFGAAVKHTPVQVTETALALARTQNVDCLIALGGGSAIGLTKALAVRTQWPQIAIPTTYSGSEMTDILGETDAGEKRTRRAASIRPRVVIYDPDLTLALPIEASVTSGLNALAHAAEALYAVDAQPLASLMAEEGLRALAHSLPVLVRAPRDRSARSAALYGAWLCGSCLGSVSMALHHKLCHVLGGLFDLPHADTHAVMLPHTLAYNFTAAPFAAQRIAGALGLAGAGSQGTEIAPQIQAFAQSLGAPRSLRDLGMPEAGIALAAARALSQPYPNPRLMDLASIHALLERAWHGEDAETDHWPSPAISPQAAG